MRGIGIEHLNPTICACMEKISRYEVDSNPSFVLDRDFAIAIHQIWTNPVIQAIVNDIDPLMMDNAV